MRGVQPEVLPKLWDFMAKVAGRKFEGRTVEGYLEQLFAVKGWNLEPNTEHYFCSELLADSLHAIGWLSDSKPFGQNANNFIPQCYHPGEVYDKLLKYTGMGVVGDVQMLSGLEKVRVWVDRTYPLRNIVEDAILASKPGLGIAVTAETGDAIKKDKPTLRDPLPAVASRTEPKEECQENKADTP